MPVASKAATKGEIRVRSLNGHILARLPVEPGLEISESELAEMIESECGFPVETRQICYKHKLLDEIDMQELMSFPCELTLVRSTRTAMLAAALRGDVEMVRIVLSQQTEAKQRHDILQVADSSGRTAVHIAAAQGDLEVLYVILEFADGQERGAMLQAYANDGMTLLHFAARGGNRVLCEKLVWMAETRQDMKYMLAAQTDDGKTPFDLALEADRSSVALLFFQLSDERERREMAPLILSWATQRMGMSLDTFRPPSEEAEAAPGGAVGPRATGLRAADVELATAAQEIASPRLLSGSCAELATDLKE